MVDKQIIIQLEEDWNHAILTNDAERISPFMWEEWKIVGNEGITEKEDFLESIRSGKLNHHTMSFECIHVDVQRESAVLISKGTSAGTYGNMPFSFYELSSSTFQRRGNEWKCILTVLNPAKQ